MFTRTINFTVKGWKSLRPYRIGFRKGFKFAEEKTQGMNVETLVDTEQAFKLLALGRIDLVLEARETGMEILKKLNLKGIHVLDPPLQKVKLYHYLHKKHAAIIQPLTKAMKEVLDHSDDMH